MNAGERREASRTFSQMLREKVAASREGLRLQDLMGTDRVEGVREERTQKGEDEGGRE